MNAEYADYLLGLEKFIVIDNAMMDSIMIDLAFPLQIRWKLMAPAEPDLLFRLEIQESPKRALKIGFHHQDDTTENGLLRIDYHSRHKNPASLTPSVPAEFHPYVGIYLDQWPGHVHKVVDGFPSLAWAVPLEADPFPVKDVSGRDDIRQAVIALRKRLNIATGANFTAQFSIV